MIPGPVAGRAPVDPGTAQRQPAETGSEAADSGASFADLLAAMLAPGAPPVPLQATASAPPEAVFERLDAAEIFNETGLFRGAAPLPSAEIADAAQAAQAAQSPAAATLPSTMPAPALDPQPGSRAALSPRLREATPTAAAGAAPADRIAAGRGGSFAASVSKAAIRAMASLRGQSASPPAGPLRGALGTGEPAGLGRASPRSAAMVAQLLAARAGAAAAQVSVQAVEGGISVAARADRLSREERDRLREEIGALLASHGFAGAQIWLNGEAWPLPHGKDV
jgi:hypothetical protein